MVELVIWLYLFYLELLQWLIFGDGNINTVMI